MKSYLLGNMQPGRLMAVLVAMCLVKIASAQQSPDEILGKCLSFVQQLSIEPAQLKEEAQTHRNGARRVYTYFVDGVGFAVKHGWQKEYDKDGTLTTEFEYLGGMRTGQAKLYKDGNLSEEIKLLADGSYMRAIADKPEEQTPMSLKDVGLRLPRRLPVMEKSTTVPDLQTFENRPEGKTGMTYQYYVHETGLQVKHGEFALYYPEGEKRRSMTFVHGVEDGKDTWWREDGSLWMETVYEMGKRTSHKVHKREKPVTEK